MKEERILQCQKCKTNLFYLIAQENKNLIECVGCGNKKKIHELPNPNGLPPEQLEEVLKEATSGDI